MNSESQSSGTSHYQQSPSSSDPINVFQQAQYQESHPSHSSYFQFPLITKSQKQQALRDIRQTRNDATQQLFKNIDLNEKKAELESYLERLQYLSHLGKINQALVNTNYDIEYEEIEEDLQADSLIIFKHQEEMGTLDAEIQELKTQKVENQRLLGELKHRYGLAQQYLLKVEEEQESLRNVLNEARHNKNRADQQYQSICEDLNISTSSNAQTITSKLLASNPTITLINAYSQQIAEVRKQIDQNQVSSAELNEINTQIRLAHSEIGREKRTKQHLENNQRKIEETYREAAADLFEKKGRIDDELNKEHIKNVAEMSRAYILESEQNQSRIKMAMGLLRSRIPDQEYDSIHLSFPQ